MSNWNLPHDFDFNGRNVKYGIAGDGPPVVVVHGTPWSSFNMRHIISALSQTFTTYYFDLIGYGQSEKPDADVSLGAQNELLNQLLEFWRLDAPFIVGHDFGGTTVLRTHLINKRKFQKMVLIDPVSLAPWGSSFFQHVKQYEAAFAGVPDYMHEAMVRAYVKTAAYQPISEETLAKIIEPWTKDGGKAAFYRQIAQAKEDFTNVIQPLYSTIDQPTLILWGSEDSWIPVERGRLLHEMIPASNFKEVPNAGHLVIEEEPDLLIAEIKKFFTEDEASK